MAKNVFMIAFHSYRVYQQQANQPVRKAPPTVHYEYPTGASAASSLSSSSSASLASSSSSSISSIYKRHNLYGLKRWRRQQHRQQLLSRQQKQKKLLHRTIRRSASIVRRRITQIPQAFYNFTSNSNLYPFARRRNDGGRGRTAFALYGLPFRTPHVPRPATSASSNSPDDTAQPQPD